MNQKQKTKNEKIIEDFIRSKERMEKFIKEELESIKSPVKERLRNMEIEA
jgi:hypothetical protein